MSIVHSENHFDLYLRECEKDTDLRYLRLLRGQKEKLESNKINVWKDRKR